MMVTENNDSLLAAKARLQERILKGQPAPAQKVNRLKLKDIRECRAVSLNRWGQQLEEFHARDLAAFVKQHPDQPLAPIVVFWIGDGYCVIDGHHRLEAYRLVKTTKAIPVSVFSGKLEDAMMFAVSNNSKNKLAMTKTEKCNAAWRLIIATNKSKDAVTKATGVSYGFVGSLRRIKKSLEAKHPEVALDSLTWDGARRLEANVESYDFDETEKRKEEAKKLADRISKAVGDIMRRDHELAYEAMAIYSQPMLEFFVEYHQPAPDEMSLPIEYDVNPDF